MSIFSLEPFSKKNMELVLNWRNTERVRLNMLDDSIISEHEHSAFLNNIKKDLSKAYFVVNLNGKAVGCIYFTDLDKPIVTWGCYIGLEKIIPGLFVALVVLAGKFSFSHENVEFLRSEVAVHNINPIKLNKFLGIPISEYIDKKTACGESVKFIQYMLARDGFIELTEKSFKIMPSSIRVATENFIVEL